MIYGVTVAAPLPYDIDYNQSLVEVRDGKHLFENKKQLHYSLMSICLVSCTFICSYPVWITVLFQYMLSLETSYV